MHTICYNEKLFKNEFISHLKHLKTKLFSLIYDNMYHSSPDKYTHRQQQVYNVKCLSLIIARSQKTWRVFIHFHFTVQLEYNIF